MRTLGSFNQRVNFPLHREDWQPERPGRVATEPSAILGYDLGVHRNAIEHEAELRSGAEKVAMGRGRERRVNAPQRMAGQALDADIKQSSGLRQAFTQQPIAGMAELRLASS
jgi:hypothetical protein